MTYYYDEIKEFPDGLWFVKWVDRVRPNFENTGSPSIEVLLCRIPDDITDDELFNYGQTGGFCHALFFGMSWPAIPPGNPAHLTERLKRGTELKICQTHAGYLPGLAAGSVYRDRRRVALIRPPEREILANGAPFLHEIASVDSASPLPLPESWGEEYPHNVLPGWYGISNKTSFQDSFCIILNANVDGEESQVVIPCFEIFRIFYAPTTDLANAFLSAPWDLSWPNFLHQSHTGRTTSGLHQIYPKKRIVDNLIPILGNLVSGDPGEFLAKTIFRAPPTPGGYMKIKSPIPFGWDRLEIKARCLTIYPEYRKYLVTHITQVRWLDDTVVVGKVNEDLIRENDPSSVASSPFEQNIPVPVTKEGYLTVTSALDPSGTIPAHVPVPGAEWVNVPPVQQLPSVKRIVRPGRHRIVNPVEAFEASNGNFKAGGRPVVQADTSADKSDNLNQRFSILKDLLNLLQEKGEISELREVQSPEGRRFWGLHVNRDAFGVARSQWTYDVPTRCYRTAYVLSFNRRGHIGHWLEVDTWLWRSASETYASLVCQLNIDDLIKDESKHKTFVRKLLDHVALKDISKSPGVWNAQFCVESGWCKSASVFKHMKGDDNKLSSDYAKMILDRVFS